MKRYLLGGLIVLLILGLGLTVGHSPDEMVEARQLPVNTLEQFQPQATITWSVVGIAHSRIDMAGQYRVWVDITDGTLQNQIMLVYKKDPGSATILADAVKQVAILNNPPPSPPTVEQQLQEQLSQVQAALDSNTTLISQYQTLMNQIQMVLNGGGNDKTKLSQIQALIRGSGITVP